MVPTTPDPGTLVPAVPHLILREQPQPQVFQCSRLLGGERGVEQGAALGGHLR